MAQRPKRDRFADQLPDCLRGVGPTEPHVVRTNLLFQKADRGFAYILRRWAGMCDMAKMHFFDLATRKEIASHQEDIKRVLLSETKLPVRNAMIRKLCVARDPAFKEVLGQLKSQTQESVRRDIGLYLSRIPSMNIEKDLEGDFTSMSGAASERLQSNKVFFAYSLRKKALILELTRHIEHNHGAVETVLMDEISYSGRSLPEKFEDVARDCVFGIFVLTADDELSITTSARCVQEKRPRQNVVLELGYFWGMLGRRMGIAVLVEDGVTLPSDVDALGRIRITEDLAETKLRLSKELRDAGIG